MTLHRSTKFSTSYNVLVVHPSVPVHSVAELVAYLKAQPDKYTFSSGGFGTPAHLAGELFKVQTGVKATHVPYQALPQAIGDLIGGTNQYMFVTTLPVIDLIATGKLRALAVTAPQRVPVLKDVPTVVEQGFPELVVQDWVGYLVKSGTPEERRTVERGDQQSAGEAERARGDREARRRTRGRYARGVRRLRECAAHLLGQGREGFRNENAQ